MILVINFGRLTIDDDEGGFSTFPGAPELETRDGIPFRVWINLMCVVYFYAKVRLIIMVGWLFWFYGISTFVDYLIPNQFLYKQSVLF